MKIKTLLIIILKTIYNNKHYYLSVDIRWIYLKTMELKKKNIVF